MYTREMGTICPFGVFPLFYSIFRFRIGHFPFKTQCFANSLKRPYSGPKRTNGEFGVPKTPEMPVEQGKRHNTTTGPQWVLWEFHPVLYL